MKFLGSRPQHEDLKLLVEDSDAVEGNLAKFDSSGNPVDSGIASNAVPIATTADLTFYVNPSTGSDENDGSSGSPFKTIAHAISLIPQIVNHTVTINLADGSYSEGITLNGYMGKGHISITGNSSNPENVVISGQVHISNNAVRVVVSYFKCTHVDNAAIYVTRNPAFVFIDYYTCVASSSYEGVRIDYGSTVRVSNSTISNRSIGILANYVSSVMSYINSGSSNGIGLNAYASVIMKYGTQPGGTTGESAVGGGVIR